MTDREKMKEKLKEYLDAILADAPVCPRTEELRAELYQNMCDKYDDLIDEGKTSATAYNAVVAGLGDISPLLDGLTDHPSATTTLVGDNDAKESESAHMRTKAQCAAVRRYRRRSAILIPAAVVLYILSVLPVILLDGYRENLGIVCMFSMVAIATGILIFNHMSRPIPFPDRQGGECANEAASKPKEGEPSSPHRSLYKAVSGALWIFTVLAYLIVSFLTMRWELTWMIFLIAVAIDNIVKAIFDLTA